MNLKHNQVLIKNETHKIVKYISIPHLPNTSHNININISQTCVLPLTCNTCKTKHKVMIDGTIKHYSEF